MDILLRYLALPTFDSILPFYVAALFIPLIPGRCAFVYVVRSRTLRLICPFTLIDFVVGCCYLRSLPRTPPLPPLPPLLLPTRSVVPVVLPLRLRVSRWRWLRYATFAATLRLLRYALID